MCTPSLNGYPSLVCSIFEQRTKISKCSLVSYLSRVKKLHTFLGFLTTGFSGIVLKLTLMGLRCLNPHIPRHARPMTPAILNAIYNKLDMNKASDIIFWLICLMAFFLLFRKLNLLPDTSKGFNPRRQLKVGDCVVKNGKLVIGICWAKNEQLNRELLTFPLPVLGESILCLVAAFRRVLNLFPHKNSHHLFRFPNGKSYTYRISQKPLRQVLKLAQVPYFNQFSSHPFRHRGTTFYFLCGVPVEVIKLMGNWKSNAYLAYLEFPLETRSAACKLMKIGVFSTSASANRASAKQKH